MKKLLVLMLVLGMASMASAALQISVNGDYDVPESTIYLLPSETVILDIGTTIPIGPGGEGEGMWALGCATTCGVMSGGSVVISDDDWEIGLVGSFEDLGVSGHPEGENGVAGWIYTFGKDIPAGTIYDEILFHCESANGPTLVSLYQLDDNGVVIGVWDTVTIHQIPEPMTIALLGLGGLFLRRRK